MPKPLERLRDRYVVLNILAFNRYRRYRLAAVPDFWRQVDRAFWEKYQLVATGQARDRVLCEPAGGLS